MEREGRGPQEWSRGRLGTRKAGVGARPGVVRQVAGVGRWTGGALTGRKSLQWGRFCFPANPAVLR